MRDSINSSKRSKPQKRNYEDDDGLVTEDVWANANEYIQKLQTANTEYSKENESKGIIIHELDGATDKAYAHIKQLNEEITELKQTMQTTKSRGHTTKAMINKLVGGGYNNIDTSKESGLNEKEKEKAKDTARCLYMSKMKKYNICIGTMSTSTENL